MGKVNTTDNSGERVEQRTQEPSTVKASDIRDYYNNTEGGVSVAEVAEHFDVEESHVHQVLGTEPPPAEQPTEDGQ